MKHLTPRIIAEVTQGKYVGDDSALDSFVAGAVRDNRDVKPGNLFVCICGSRVDGHSFANSAFESGASCCLAQRHKQQQSELGCLLLGRRVRPCLIPVDH